MEYQVGEKVYIIWSHADNQVPSQSEQIISKIVIEDDITFMKFYNIEGKDGKYYHFTADQLRKIIDTTKSVSTVSGHKARIIDTNIKGPYNIAVAVELSPGNETVLLYNKFGVLASIKAAVYNTDYDLSKFVLVNVPTRHKYWMNVYNKSGIHHLEHSPGHYFYFFRTREEADNAFNDSERVACVEIDFTEK